MKELKTYLNEVEKIDEASRNEKHRLMRFAKNMYPKGDTMGNIKTFGLITAENPNSIWEPDDKKRKKENYKRNDDLKKSFKARQLTHVAIDGYWVCDDNGVKETRKEHSFMVFNASIADMIALAKQYEQTSFFYCYPVENGIMNEYWEKNDNGKYEFINKTTAWHNNDAENYTIVGGDFKFTIDASVFERVNEEYETALNKVLLEHKIAKDKEDLLQWGVMRCGYKASVCRKYIYDAINNEDIK